MNQPRQVPWTSLRELEQVYLAIYTSKDHEFVIHRLAAWKYSGSLPQALDATLALLVAMKTDLNSVPNQEFNSSPRVSGSGFAARQGYALAIIRFVNGIVDPLQVGVFARSIAAIATQVEMPLSLVELRHACTHEELPSLEALRDGAKLVFYFLPLFEISFHIYPSKHPYSFFFFLSLSTIRLSLGWNRNIFDLH
jgi:ribosomal biogenesis protein LAS1